MMPNEYMFCDCLPCFEDGVYTIAIKHYHQDGEMTLAELGLQDIASKKLSMSTTIIGNIEQLPSTLWKDVTDKKLIEELDTKLAMDVLSGEAPVWMYPGDTHD